MVSHIFPIVSKLCKKSLKAVKRFKEQTKPAQNEFVYVYCSLLALFFHSSAECIHYSNTTANKTRNKRKSSSQKRNNTRRQHFYVACHVTHNSDRLII